MMWWRIQWAEGAPSAERKEEEVDWGGSSSSGGGGDGSSNSAVAGNKDWFSNNWILVTFFFIADSRFHPKFQRSCTFALYVAVFPKSTFCPSSRLKRSVEIIKK
uniref:Uncharacterized protein n=1 Tax=Sphaerodactylus townsendi TaxID=933632 RepID=A0ACB8G494_9SAUR